MTTTCSTWRRKRCAVCLRWPRRNRSSSATPSPPTSRSRATRRAGRNDRRGSRRSGTRPGSAATARRPRHDRGRTRRHLVGRPEATGVAGARTAQRPPRPAARRHAVGGRSGDRTAHPARPRRRAARPHDAHRLPPPVGVRRRRPHPGARGGAFWNAARTNSCSPHRPPLRPFLRRSGPFRLYAQAAADRSAALESRPEAGRERSVPGRGARRPLPARLPAQAVAVRAAVPARFCRLPRASSLVSFCLEMAGPWLLRHAIDGPMRDTAAAPEARVHSLLWYGAAFLGATVGGALLGYVYGLLTAWNGQRVIRDVRRVLFDHLLRTSARVPREEHGRQADDARHQRRREPQRTDRHRRAAVGVRPAEDRGRAGRPVLPRPRARAVHRRHDAGRRAAQRAVPPQRAARLPRGARQARAAERLHDRTDRRRAHDARVRARSDRFAALRGAQRETADAWRETVLHFSVFFALVDLAVRATTVGPACGSAAPRCSTAPCSRASSCNSGSTMAADLAGEGTRREVQRAAGRLRELRTRVRPARRTEFPPRNQAAVRCGAARQGANRVRSRSHSPTTRKARCYAAISFSAEARADDRDRWPDWCWQDDPAVAGSAPARRHQWRRAHRWAGRARPRSGRPARSRRLRRAGPVPVHGLGARQRAPVRPATSTKQRSGARSRPSAPPTLCASCHRAC
jgi:hypothetical protein